MNNFVQNEVFKKNLETGVPFLTRVCLPASGSTAKPGLPRDWYFFFDRLTSSWPSRNFHFIETEIQNTIKPPWSNGHPFLPLCPNLSSFLPFIIICAEYFYFFACHAMLWGKKDDHSQSSLPCEQWFLQAGRARRETFSPVASGLEKPLLAG